MSIIKKLSGNKKMFSDALFWGAFLVLVPSGMFFFAEKNEASVLCEEITGGMSCAVTRARGTSQINVCWEVNQICSNGQKLVAKKCRAAPSSVGTSEVSLIAKTEFTN